MSDELDGRTVVFLRNPDDLPAFCEAPVRQIAAGERTGQATSA